MTAEQAAEAARGLTFEKVWAALMESRKEMRESRERQERASAEMDKRLEQSRAEMEKQMKETFAEIREGFAASKAMSEQLDKRVDKITDSIGRVIEGMFAANLWKKFAGRYTFTRGGPQTFLNKDGTMLTQVDVFVENGEYALVVEVKTTLRKDDVDYHLQRIQKLRGYLDERGDKRKLVGAVAGAVFHQGANDYAHKKGLYVLKQSGESAVLVDPPRGFKAAEW
jgi:hypothetical protein